jgi:hypothetical protein
MSAERASASLLTAVAVALTSAASADALPAARAAVAGPSVQSMIVGSTGATLSQPRAIGAGATTVRVGARSCAVAAGTPLAVLAALRRGGGPPFALRDYGHCGSNPANSGELFVYSIGGQTNRGQNGWEYKVNNESGSTGAADATGPMGDGRRLRSGQRVLWFWCAAVHGGCERTLEVSSPAAGVRHGGSLTVAVTGYDSEGRGVPIAGAIVTLGSDFASTGTGGRATLLAPRAPGRYQLSASRSGLVSSFPQTIVVG